MRMQFFAALALITLALTGCSPEPDPDPNNIISGNNPTRNNGESPDTGTDMAVAPDMGGMPMPDVGEPADTGFDFAVDSPGEMHGSWRLENSADSSFIASLQLKHSEGSTTVEGTYQMDEPASFGRLAGANYVDATFATSWTISVEDSNEQFGVSDCSAAGDGTYDCRYSTTLAGAIVDSRLVPQP